MPTDNEIRDEEENKSGALRVIQRTNMTDMTRLRFDNSPSKHYKKVLQKIDLNVPTSFIALPYELKLDRETQQLCASRENKDLELAEAVGQHLLTMNKIIAKLSFWMSMDNYGTRNKHGKKKIMDWLNRSRKEENTNLIAFEIVSEIRVGSQYVEICQEILEEDEFGSNARAYIDDPMKAATNEYKQCTEDILKCYEDSLSERLFFYLVDEYSWVPVQSSSYPIHVRAKKSYLLENLFLQFMSTSLMAASALDELTSVAKLLGLPPCAGIPTSWMNAKAGLVHMSTDPSSVEKFAMLQHEIRKQLKSAGGDSDKRETQTKQQRGAHEAFLLRKFYMTYDPTQRFSNLLRLSDGEGSKIWISNTVWQQIEADAQELREKSSLKSNDTEKKTMEDMDEEMKMLMIALNNAPILGDSELSHSYHPSSSSGKGLPSPHTGDLSLSRSTHGKPTEFLKQSSSSQKGKKKLFYRGKKLASSLWRRNQGKTTET